MLVLLLSLRGCFAQAGIDLGELLQHLVEVFSPDSHHFYVVQSGAGRGTNPTTQQTDLPEVTAFRKIGQHQFATRIFLRDLYEPRRTR